MIKQVILSLTLLISTTSYFTHSKDNQNIDDSISHVKQPVRFVNLTFSDIHGNLKEVIQLIPYFEKSLKNGVTFDGSSMPGFASVNESDLLLKPDSSTTVSIPSYSLNQHASTNQQVSTMRVMCDIYNDEYTPCESSPRYVLQKIMAQAEEMGYEFYVGPELEFFIFSQQKNKPTVCDQEGYFASGTSVRMQTAKKMLITMLQEQNINVEKLHHEVAPGQYEISIKYGNALSIADQILLAKHTIKTMAQTEGMQATFMPKPFFGINGSGMHLNFSLFDINNQCNAFYDADDPNHLSPIAQQFIAGVLNHVREITLLLNPTVNSYKRLVKGYEAPVNVCWGVKNRSALIRIPYVSDNQPNGVRAEIRSPDATTNPYLAFAALLLAGLTGIKNNEKLSKSIEKNLYRLDETALKAYNIQLLPGSLDEAIDLFEVSQFAQELLGEELFDKFIKLKRQEASAFKRAVTDWEWDWERGNFS